MNPPIEEKLLSVGMVSVLIAQFFSALADNAILIVAISIVKAQGMNGLVSLLQESFVVPFILLAPFLGQIADVFPKSRVMLVGNLLKLSGALLMMVNVNPLLAYGLIGVGAAMYSPAKYGILSQMVSAKSLVKANGMMEGSTIVAILSGVLLGGWLADHSLSKAFIGVIASYGIAAIVNLFIPKLPAEKLVSNFNPLVLVREFGSSVSILFKNADSRFSLLGTSMFWGSGTTLRLMLFAWVPAALLITDNQTPANLMGAVSIGIVIGAVTAGAFVSLAKVNRALLGGLMLGPVILSLALVHSLSVAMVVMIAIGLCGGFFVVPLNALLQARGHESIGAGNALAVQNFVENSSMLLFVGGYSLLASVHVSVTVTFILFGTLLILSIGALSYFRLKQS